MHAPGHCQCKHDAFCLAFWIAVSRDALLFCVVTGLKHTVELLIEQHDCIVACMAAASPVLRNSETNSQIKPRSWLVELVRVALKVKACHWLQSSHLVDKSECIEMGSVHTTL